MKKIVHYYVHLTDDAREPLAGATEFEAHYDNRLDGGLYVFERNEPARLQAEADLHRLALPFRVTYSIRLAPEEIATYPAFWLHAYPNFGLIDFAQNPPRVREATLAHGMAQDIASSTYVLAPACRDGLAALGIQLEVSPAQTSRRKPAWLVARLPALPEPYEIYMPTAPIEKDAPPGTYVEADWDLRLRLSPATSTYLQQHHLGRGASFRYLDKTYSAYGPGCLISGTLARWLHATYGERIHLVPAVLAEVWNDDS